VSALDHLAETLNALLEAAQAEDWIQLEVLEPELNTALAQLTANPLPANSADSLRKKLEKLLAVQQQVTERCTNRMKQISPLLDALSIPNSAETNP
jgi:hypothetical protein